MATQGPLYPGTVTTEVGPSGDNGWTNPGNISADDGTEARITAATYDAGDHSYRLKAQNFGFSVPSDATIDGITVEIDRRDFAGDAQDQEVRLFDASGTLAGDDKQTATSWPATLAVATYGGASDTWTISPTPAMVNDADFGVALIVLANSANTDIAVDFIRVTVHYTPNPNVTVTPTTAALTITTYAPTVTVPITGDNAYEDAVLADSPTFLASMEEASGNLTDIIGGKTGTANGTPTYGVTGPITGKTAIAFPASTDFFTFADHADLDLGDGPYTLEMWFGRDADTATWQGAFNKGTNAYAIGINPSDKYNSGKMGVAEYVQSTGTVAADSSWHHVVVTKAAGTGAGRSKLYVDGVDATSEGDTTTTSADTTTTLEVGREGSGQRSAGRIAYIAIYKSVLSSTRVAAHYDAATATDVTVTPTTASLTLTTYAPTVSAPRLVTPTTASLTTATFAPTVSVSDNKSVTPTTASLSLTTFAPTVSTTANVTVTPAVASLSLATFAPTVSTTAHQTVTPTTAALTLTTFAPTVTGGAGVTVTPGVASLTLTTFAPTVSTPVTVTPGVASLLTARFAPTVTASDHKSVTPAAASLTLTTFAPSVSTPLLVTPSAASLTLTTHAPSVASGNAQTFTPTTASLVLTTFAPTVSTPVVVTPDAAILSIASFAPTVLTPQALTPTTATLTLTTFAPTATVSSVTIGSAVISLVERIAAALGLTERYAASMTLTLRYEAALSVATEYDLNDTASPSVTFTVDGAATDPTTITLTVIPPDKTPLTYTYAGGTVTKSSTGVYTKDITLSQRGVWYLQFAGTGTCQATAEGTLRVRA